MRETQAKIIPKIEALESSKREEKSLKTHWTSDNCFK